MIMPELPEYLASMGGEKYLGLIVGVFTLSAAASRFWSGRLADKIGRVKVILFGSVVTMLCGSLYIFTTTISAFFILRFIHGFSTGWRPIGSTAYLTDIVPISRRGEAMGYLGVAGSTGMALGPALGSVLTEEVSIDSMFIVSSIIGLASLILSLKLPESLPNPEKLKWAHFNLFKGQVMDLSSMPASVVTFFDVFAFGVILTLSPIHVDNIGFTYKGSFNLTFVLVSMVMRLLAGKSSDKYGRIKLIKIGLVITAIGLLIIGYADTILMVSIGGVVYGIALGINRPTIFAWTADLSPPKNIAASMATMLLALELGIMGGAMISSEIYDGNPENISHAFELSALMCGFALIYLFYYQWKLKKNTESSGIQS